MTADLTPGGLPEEHRDLEVLARWMNFENKGLNTIQYTYS